MKNREFIRGAVIVLIALAIVACGETATRVKEPTVAPTKPPALPTALPVGTAAMAPNGWEITVVGFDPDAWPEVQAENEFNDPPRSGNRMILVTVKVTNVETEDEPAEIGDADFYLVGSSNVLYSTYEEESRCGVIPDELNADLTHGGSAQGNICFQLPIDETDLRLGYEYEWHEYVFVSVE